MLWCLLGSLLWLLHAFGHSDQFKRYAALTTSDGSSGITGALLVRATFDLGEELTALPLLLLLLFAQDLLVLLLSFLLLLLHFPLSLIQALLLDSLLLHILLHDHRPLLSQILDLLSASLFILLFLPLLLLLHVLQRHALTHRLL